MISLETSVEKIKNDTGAFTKFKVEVPEGIEDVGKCPDMWKSSY